MGWSSIEADYGIPPALALGYALVIAVAIIVPRYVFTDPPRAMSTLQRAGFSSIHIVGYSALACHDDDEQWRTTFSARSPEDAMVTGVVCQSTTRRGTILVDSTSDGTLTPVTQSPELPEPVAEVADAAAGVVP